MRPTALLVLTFTFAGCGHGAASGPVRFVNELPVSSVNDRMDVPERPAERMFPFLMYVFDTLWVDAVTGALSLRKSVRAANVNSIDEVPDSTWFRNRIAVRELSPGEIAMGPGRSAGVRLPFTITSSKVGGGAPGFIVDDATGQRFLLKFDARGAPEMETGAHVVVQRLLWACGYNVPEDEVVYFERDQLILAESAVIEDVFGNRRPMTERFVAEQLALSETRPGQPIRGLASRYVAGIPIGGFSPEGTRDDDPNDTVPHQHRRELRGLQPIAAWVAHTDIKEGNTLDVWAADPENPGHHYVVHYLIDFGKSLGVMAYSEAWRGYSFAHSLDWPWLLRSTATAGLWPRPWDGISVDHPEGVGLFDSASFDPGRFRTNLPFLPFGHMDRFDGFWGAKIVARFTRAQLEAVVARAQYSDPRTSRYVVDTLVARQKKTARYWFGKVAPVDRFRLTETGRGIYELCFDDLMLAYELEPADARVNYRARFYDHGGALLGAAQAGTRTRGERVCFRHVTPGPTHQGYVIVRLDRSTATRTSPPVWVHMALGRGKALRIIGLWRG